MPNHVTNRLNLIGEQTRIDELLDKIKNDELGRGTIDFNKISLEDYCLYYDEKTGNYEYREESEESETPEMS